MPTDLPIACSLDAPDLAQRLAEIAALGRAAMLDARNDGCHAELRFGAGAAVRERVETIVAAESKCCGFLAMRVSDGAHLLLTIDAPAGGETALAEIVDAFRGRAQPA